MKKDVCCVFDLSMAKAIYVGHILGRKSPSNMQRYIGLIEASLEAFPQLLMSTFYVLTLAAHKNTGLSFSPIITISLVSSLYSLTSRVSSDDTSIFNPEWRHLEFNDIFLISNVVSSIKAFKHC